MDAYQQPLVLCRLITTIIRQRKKILEKSKKSKNTIKRMFTLGLRITLFFCVCMCMFLFRLFLHIIVCSRICDS